jgi:soluble lytic murein transglycosylase-like protein
MIRKICIAVLAVAALTSAASARHLRVASLDGNGNLDALIARHAAANNVPEALVRRIIKRESGGRPGVVSRGNYGLMQIKLATARSMGYSGGAAGLLDADTNMTYAVKYLAGAYHTAHGNTDRAVHYYAAGYYYAAKGQGRLARNDTATSAFASVAGNPAATSRTQRVEPIP